ncbi:MAG: methyltransferase domain-containing protein [Candidatus Omnitrophota bacterium]|jgi:ubiquinone/menaquinone biosynthesis C-methylase UbiE|nr:methyltransferase domain-containing protein [Candidatus Omnitrophota bacterium]MDD5526128.1 methyltransferase domain-containing protein [Candidatus Omnitrophota bacterium]
MILRNKILLISSLFLLFISTQAAYGKQRNGHCRFIVFGGMKLGMSDSGDFKRAVDKMKEFHPDFVLFLGDMISATADEDPEHLWREFDRIGRRLSAPKYTVYGYSFPRNIPPDKQRILDLETSYLKRNRKKSYAFVHKNNLFICLDTYSQYPASGGDDYQHTFVFLSRPAGMKQETFWQDTIHPRLAKKVDCVFELSSSFPEVKNIGGVPHITSSFCPLNQPADPGNLFHFLLVDINGPSIEVKIVPIDPIPLPLDNGFNEREPRTFYKNDFYNARYLLTTPIREQLLLPQQVIETMEIKPGMRIADIGAGKGFFTFRLARALHNTGMVFATEVHPDLLEYISRRAKTQNLDNITAVLVGRDRYDEFYKKHEFDIILLCEVFNDLPENGDYFEKLALSLKKETGRLYIINFKNIAPFHKVDFGDFTGVITFLKDAGEDHPVFIRLHPRVREYIVGDGTFPAPPGIEELLFEDCNRMLLDKDLFKELLNHYSRKWDILRPMAMAYLCRPPDRGLVRWLALRMETCKDSPGGFTETQKRELHTLNKAVLSRLLGLDKVSFFKGEGIGVIFKDKQAVIEELSRSGFTFVREHDFLSQYYFLEFKK